MVGTARGQIWSLDLALSLFVFFTAFFLLMFSWSYISGNAAENDRMRTMQLDALTISDHMVRTGGLPDQWNPANVRAIGLADEENVINTTKAGYFAGLDYSFSRALLGISEEFYFQIADINGTVYVNTSFPVGEADAIVPVERYVLYDGSMAKLTMVIWSNRTLI